MLTVTPISYNKKYVALSGWKFMTLYDIDNDNIEYIEGHVDSWSIRFFHNDQHIAYIADHKLIIKRLLNFVINCDILI